MLSPANRDGRELAWFLPQISGFGTEFAIGTTHQRKTDIATSPRFDNFVIAILILKCIASIQVDAGPWANCTRKNRRPI